MKRLALIALLLALAWAMPLGARVLAKVALLPVGVVTVAILFVWLLANARRTPRGVPAESGSLDLAATPLA